MGFLADSRGPQNPDGLPVGFSRVFVDLSDRKPYSCWKGDWVGLTCAACHTGQLRHLGQQIRIEGGPAHHDVELFGDRLSAALAATFSSGSKFTRFVRGVLASGTTTTPSLLRESLTCFLQDSAQVHSFLESAQLSAAEEPTAPGFGRLDAVHRGGNLLLAAPLLEPKNYAPTTAPVSFPALWDTPYFDWVLYNASIRQPMARNVIEALAVGSPLDPKTILSGRVAHGVKMDNLVEIHRWLRKLQSPRWPEDILGPIDRAKAGRGEAIYVQACATCHQRIDPAAHVSLDRPPAGADKDIVISSVPLDQIGTDPRQARNFAERMMALASIGGPPEIAYYKAANILTERVVEQWAQESPRNAEAEREIDRGKPNEFRGLLAYRARPLNGIWATAPYLHNGSVPSLYELLLAPHSRSRIFYVGNWEFDPVHVGVRSSSPFTGASLFDTRLPGNSNGGHPYGTNLSEEDRMALIEYLKTL
jgi:mono/diheme cytochrome c family protein